MSAPGPEKAAAPPGGKDAKTTATPGQPEPGLAKRRGQEIAARCPLCRDEIEVAETGWTCCARCLTRHHRACWKEQGSCVSCGADQPLAFAPTRHDLQGTMRPPTARHPLRAGISLGLGAACVGLVLFAPLGLGLAFALALACGTVLGTAVAGLIRRGS